MMERPRPRHERLPVSLILTVSMIAAGVVYPVTDSALHHTSPIMIATLRALLGGLILALALPLLRSHLPRTFLVPVVAVLIDAAQGALPGPSATVGIIVVIIGVAIVNNPRAEAPTTAELQGPPAPAKP